MKMVKKGLAFILLSLSLSLSLCGVCATESRVGEWDCGRVSVAEQLAFPSCLGQTQTE